jgi:hypothetical protein
MTALNRRFALGAHHTGTGAGRSTAAPSHSGSPRRCSALAADVFRNRALSRKT